MAYAYIKRDIGAVRSSCCNAPVFGEITIYYTYVYLWPDGYSKDDAIIVEETHGPIYCDECHDELVLNFDWPEEAAGDE